ncbi:hypothetical protein BGZ92_004328 [Podila epicladia]|nr:hypothetical protein BGZ92_004328 [Podila epicladia]
MSTAAPLVNTAAKTQASSNLAAGSGLLLQRKCACESPTSSLADECEECKSKKQLGLQKKLKIGEPGDVYEQEADHVANEVMAVPVSTFKRNTPSLRSTVQRKVERGSGMEMDVPLVVDEVLRSYGQPLDIETRSFMEKRFGHDFGEIRIHADARAAASANMLGASAYTVGQDVVFAAGHYRPFSDTGRHLLSHELVHTIQQRNGSVRVQRSCAASPRPPLPVSINAFFPRWEAAEKCIQTMYARSHPAKIGISLSFNADWLHLTGSGFREQEKMALRCLRGEETPGAGPNFTAKSGMYAAAPDIWDFQNQTMYEITTPSGAWFRMNKLGIQIKLANKICEESDKCGGLQFGRGTWSPSSGSGYFALGGDLYFTATNNDGVIIYNLLKDASKGLALSALLAAVSLKKFGPKGGLAVAGNAVGKLTPAYAVASMIVAVGLLSSGRAEAKLGPGEEPLVTLFKAFEQKGIPVPPEISEMLDANPVLKEKLNKAMAEGGDLTKAQEEINKQILDTIAANRDKFTPEELEVLLASSLVVGKALPNGGAVDELKKLATAVGVGYGGTSNSGRSERGMGSKKISDISPTDRPSQSAGKNIVNASPETPAERLVMGLASQDPEGPKWTPALKEKILAAVRTFNPPLSDKEVDELLKYLWSAVDKSEDEIVESVRKRVKALRTSKGGGEAPEQGSPKPGDAKRTDGGEVGLKLKVNKANPTKRLKGNEKDISAAYDKGMYKIDWVEEGKSYLVMPAPVYETGKTYSLLYFGRDIQKILFVGHVLVTIGKKDADSWEIAIAAGAALYTKGRRYGTTRTLTDRVVPPEGLLSKGGH